MRTDRFGDGIIIRAFHPNWYTRERNVPTARETTVGTNKSEWLGVISRNASVRCGTRTRLASVRRDRFSIKITVIRKYAYSVYYKCSVVWPEFIRLSDWLHRTFPVKSKCALVKKTIFSNCLILERLQRLRKRIHYVVYGHRAFLIKKYLKRINKRLLVLQCKTLTYNFYL